MLIPNLDKTFLKSGKKHRDGLKNIGEARLDPQNKGPFF